MARIRGGGELSGLEELRRLEGLTIHDPQSQPCGKAFDVGLSAMALPGKAVQGFLVTAPGTRSLR